MHKKARSQSKHSIMVLSIASVRFVRMRTRVALNRQLIRHLIRTTSRLRQILKHRVRVVGQRLDEALRHRIGPEEIVIQ